MPPSEPMPIPLWPLSAFDGHYPVVGSNRPLLACSGSVAEPFWALPTVERSRENRVERDFCSAGCWETVRQVLRKSWTRIAVQAVPGEQRRWSVPYAAQVHLHEGMGSSGEEQSDRRFLDGA